MTKSSMPSASMSPGAATVVPAAPSPSSPRKPMARCPWTPPFRYQRGYLPPCPADSPQRLSRCAQRVCPGSPASTGGEEGEEIAAWTKTQNPLAPQRQPPRNQAVLGRDYGSTMEKTRCCYCSREVLWSSSVASLRGGRSSSALWLNDLTIISQQCAGETVLFNDW